MSHIKFFQLFLKWIQNSSPDSSNRHRSKNIKKNIIQVFSINPFFFSIFVQYYLIKICSYENNKKPKVKLLMLSYLQWTACSGDTAVRPFHFQREFFVLFRKYFNSSSGVSNCSSACLQYSLWKKEKMNIIFNLDNWNAMKIH